MVITAKVCPIVVFSLDVMELRPICAVRRLLDVKTNEGHRYYFHTFKFVNTLTVATTVLDMGRTMVKKYFSGLQKSN